GSFATGGSLDRRAPRPAHSNTSSCAAATASARRCVPSFEHARPRSVFTLSSPMPRIAAISRFVCPAATCCSTSRSRGLSAAWLRGRAGQRGSNQFSPERIARIASRSSRVLPVLRTLPCAPASRASSLNPGSAFAVISSAGVRRPARRSSRTSSVPRRAGDVELALLERELEPAAHHRVVLDQENGRAHGLGDGVYLLLHPRRASRPASVIGSARRKLNGGQEAPACCR